MDLKSLHYIYDYLSQRKQSVRINNDFNEWKNIIYGVLQGSILGPLFFNIPYTCESYIEVIVTLEKSTESIFQWVKDNFLKTNSDKSHVVLTSESIQNTQSQILLGTTIDSELKFDTHVNILCNKANLKLYALARISSFILS